jgi:hypothetical protein
MVCMSGLEFDELRKRFKKRVLDVSYETKLSPQTVYNFINGENSNPSTQDLLRRYAEALLEAEASKQKATAS